MGFSVAQKQNFVFEFVSANEIKKITLKYPSYRFVFIIEHLLKLIDYNEYICRWMQYYKAEKTV